MEEKMNSYTAAKTCLLIALAFLTTGSGFLTWVYHLREFYAAGQVDILTQVIGYPLQAAGLFAGSLMASRDFNLDDDGSVSIRLHSFTLFACGWLALLGLSGFAPSGPVTLIFGYGMNFMIGLVASCYLIALAAYADPKHTALTFGAGYGAGSILSFLLSLPAGGTFLAQPYVYAVYAVFTAALIAVYRSIVSHSDTQPTAYRSPETTGTDKQRRLLTVAAPVVILLSLVSNAGAFFPIASAESSAISLELSRAFYAVGLVAAGLISDKRRSVGAALCVAALCFPFFSLTAAGSIGAADLLRVLGYIFFGFYAVYRVILYVDLSERFGVLKFACCGLMFGRLGDAAGALIGIRLSGRPALLTAVIAAAFVICIFLFFYLYRSLYMQPAATLRDRSLAFAETYGLSSRETQMLEMIVEGSSNKDIAAKLFISENTVKFHIRNLLKKTGCANRSGLISLFNSKSTTHHLG